jgi:hypothetical protein
MADSTGPPPTRLAAIAVKGNAPTRMEVVRWVLIVDSHGYSFFSRNASNA